MSAVWHLRSRAIDEVVRAEDQFAAWETLRDRPATDFGLVVTAEPGEDEQQAIPIHTSALMFAWDRDDEAELFIAVAVENGLGDTTEADRASAVAIRARAENGQEQAAK